MSLAPVKYIQTLNDTMKTEHMQYVVVYQLMINPMCVCFSFDFTSSVTVYLMTRMIQVRWLGVICEEVRWLGITKKSSCITQQTYLNSFTYKL